MPMSHRRLGVSAVAALLILQGCGSEAKVTSQDAASFIRRNVERHGAPPDRLVNCVVAKGTTRTFTCAVITASGAKLALIVTCDKPKSRPSTAALNASCSAHALGP